MKALKGLAVTVLGILLFLSLTLFGTAFMLKSTVLNPGFIAAEVDKLNVTETVRELAGAPVIGQTQEETALIEKVLYDTLAEQEPWLKEQAKAAVNVFYNYLLGETDHISLVISLEPFQEIMRESLRQAFTDRLAEAVADPQQLPALVSPEYYDEIIRAIPREYLPQEAASLTDDQLKAYLENNSEEFVTMIPEEQYRELVTLAETVTMPYFDAYYDAFAAQFPSELTFNEASLTPQAMELLSMARQYAGYVQASYYFLIGLIVVLIAAIIIVSRNVKESTRSLGIDLLVYGALELAATLVAWQVIPGQLPLAGIPPSLAPAVASLVTGMLWPLLLFSLVVLAVGLGLLVTSFVYRSGAAEAD